MTSPFMDASSRTLIRDPSRTRFPRTSFAGLWDAPVGDRQLRRTEIAIHHTMLSPHMIASMAYDCIANDCASELATRVPGKK